jgi:hypothetical protein
MDKHEKSGGHIRQVMPGFKTLRGVFKPGLWSHLAHLEDLDGLTVKSLSWVPMVDSLQVKLSFRGEAMAIFTDWEMCPFLCGDGATSATLVDTVADHMGRCHMKGPVTVIRTRWKYSRRR